MDLNQTLANTRFCGFSITNPFELKFNGQTCSFFFCFLFNLKFEQFLEPLQIVVFNLGHCVKQLYFNPEGQGYVLAHSILDRLLFFFLSQRKKGTVVLKKAIPVMILKRRSHQARCQHSLRIKITDAGTCYSTVFDRLDSVKAASMF